MEFGCWLREIQARQAFGPLTPGNHVRQFLAFGKAEMSLSVVILKEFYLSEVALWGIVVEVAAVPRFPRYRSFGQHFKHSLSVWRSVRR